MPRKIEVLGTGCPRCRRLIANTEDAMRRAGIDGAVEKVTDLNAILAYGVMMTPALVIDGKVVSTGKVLTVAEIRQMLAAD